MATDQIFDGFFAPEPLLRPDLWPHREAGDKRSWLLAFDLLARHAGPLRNYLKLITSRGPVIWWISSHDVDIKALTELIKLQPMTTLWTQSENVAALKSRFPATEIIGKPVPPQAKMESWLPVLFPETVQKFGLLKLIPLARSYVTEIGDEDGFPTLALGYFSSFARQNAEPEMVSFIAREWLRANIFLSPQNEKPAVDAPNLKLNPTLETFSDDNGVWIFYRAKERLHERQLSWPEALVLDEFFEQPEQIKSELAENLIENERAARTRGLTGEETTETCLGQLIAEGIIVGEPNRPLPK